MKFIHELSVSNVITRHQWRSLKQSPDLLTPFLIQSLLMITGEINKKITTLFTGKRFWVHPTGALWTVLCKLISHYATWTTWIVPHTSVPKTLQSTSTPQPLKNCPFRKDGKILFFLHSRRYWEYFWFQIHCYWNENVLSSFPIIKGSPKVPSTISSIQKAFIKYRLHKCKQTKKFLFWIIIHSLRIVKTFSRYEGSTSTNWKGDWVLFLSHFAQQGKKTC